MTDQHVHDPEPRHCAERAEQALDRILRVYVRAASLPPDRAGPASQLTSVQASVLVNIARLQPVPVGELAAVVGMQSPGLSRMLGVLEERDLIARELDATDRRVSRVRLTPQGRDALEVRRRLIADLFEKLGPDERSEATSLLEKLASLFESARGDEPWS